MKLSDLFEEEQSLFQALRACEPYLDLPGAKHGMLFRGARLGHLGSYNIDKTTGLCWKMLTTRRDRFPADTPAELSRQADDTLHDQFGWYPRSQGVFATNNIKEAREYGTPHIIVPIGSTRYVWSPNVKDLFLWLTQKLGLYTTMAKMATDEKHAFFVAQLKKAGYKDTDLGTGIRSGHEIMLDCDRYIAIFCGDSESSTMAAVYELTDIEPD
jgi:hypothetical protein